MGSKQPRSQAFALQFALTIIYGSGGMVKTGEFITQAMSDGCEVDVWGWGGGGLR